jgi:hypothetical protein
MKLLFNYYLRYFPWLHVEYTYDENLPKPKFGYRQFLNLSLIYREGDDWRQLQRQIIPTIDTIIDRLSKLDKDWRKMPRSRDFPHNGVELIKIWRAQILDDLIQKLEQIKSKYPLEK